MICKDPILETSYSKIYITTCPKLFLCVLFCTLVYACKYIAHKIKMGKVPAAFLIDLDS